MSEDETLIDFRGVKIVPEEAKLIKEIEKDLGEKLSIQPTSSGKGAAILVESGHVIKIELWDKRFRQKHTHIFKFSKIKVIDLMKTKIPIIPPEAGNLFDLKELTLHKSNVKKIQANFDKLINLKEIYITEGEIDRVPLLPPEIEEVTLENLGLKDFPIELKACKKIKYLRLKRNPIKTIPEWFKQTKDSLKDLNLSKTKIKLIPHWFSEFRQLERMFFEDTPIEKICDLSNMQNLTRFYLKG